MFAAAGADTAGVAGAANTVEWEVVAKPTETAVAAISTAAPPPTVMRATRASWRSWSGERTCAVDMPRHPESPMKGVSRKSKGLTGGEWTAEIEFRGPHSATRTPLR